MIAFYEKIIFEGFNQTKNFNTKTAQPLIYIIKKKKKKKMENHNIVIC